jgi:hypothetical protein
MEATFLYALIVVGLVGGVALLIGKAGCMTVLRAIGTRLAQLAQPSDLPPEPELKHGNIPIISSEQENEPDLSLVFKFPDKAPPTLRYADFNTRLFVVTGSDDGPRQVSPERVSDEPTRLHGNKAFIDYLVRNQLRPAYPTIIDPHGLFAISSSMLQREPFLSSPLISAYLNIHRDKRPVVVSIPLLSEKPGVKSLLFCRYGFEDFLFQLDFLNPNWSTSLKHLFAAFLGSDLDWSNFSHARLRYLATLEDHEMAQTASLLADATEEAQRRRQEQDELALDQMESFRGVFRRPALPTPADTGASNS